MSTACDHAYFGHVVQGTFTSAEQRFGDGTDEQKARSQRPKADFVGSASGKNMEHWGCIVPPLDSLFRVLRSLTLHPTTPARRHTNNSGFVYLHFGLVIADSVSRSQPSCSVLKICMLHPSTTGEANSRLVGGAQFKMPDRCLVT